MDEDLLENIGRTGYGRTQHRRPEGGLETLRSTILEERPSSVVFVRNHARLDIAS